MAPQTRSQSKPSKASESTSYKSTAAAPKQQLFPDRRKNVKTYKGRRAPRKDPKQSTLTQMNFVPSSIPENPLRSDDEDEDEDDEDKAEEPVKAVASKKRTRSSRRKTTGDKLAIDEKPRDSKRRKTVGDVPTLNQSSSYHTQTITQMLPNKDEENEDWKIEDSEDDADAAIIMEVTYRYGLLRSIIL